MWRGSVGWRNIIYVVGGQMQYIVTHPREMARRRSYIRKVRGVGSD